MFWSFPHLQCRGQSSLLKFEPCIELCWLVVPLGVPIHDPLVVWVGHSTPSILREAGRWEQKVKLARYCCCFRCGCNLSLCPFRGGHRFASRCHQISTQLNGGTAVSLLSLSKTKGRGVTELMIASSLHSWQLVQQGKTPVALHNIGRCSPKG